MTQPLAIAVAPNGARRTKTDHASLPLTADEIALEAARCVEAGATLIHLHVRDAAGRHSLDAIHYRAAIAEIRRTAGDRVIIQATTEAVGLYRRDEQMALVREIAPEAVSLALREFVPDTVTKTEEEAHAFYSELRASGIAVQHILYDPGEVKRFLDLAARGVIPFEWPHALFVLGRYSGQAAQPGDLLGFLDRWPDDWPWSVCAFGPNEPRCAALAAALGGHVRVGFENNLTLPDGRTAGSNAELVMNVAALAKHIGRPVATVAQARQIYGTAAR